MAKQDYPFTDLRTGKKIHTPEEEISEVWALSHLAPKNPSIVDTRYGLWIHGACPACNNPIDNWYMRYHCGYCGVYINWDEYVKERENNVSKRYKFL